MPSLLVTMFILSVVILLINSFGATAINELLWQLYNKLPTPTSKAFAIAQKQRVEVLKLKQEMSSVSAQDDFAKWARIRRQHDKAVADFEKLESATASSKASFDSIVNKARWTFTTGLRWFLQFWYSKQPIFWLPRGWIPYYAEWLISWPSAPLGSVSIYMWGFACTSVISMVSEVAVAVWALTSQQKSTKVHAQAVPANLQTSSAGQGR